MKEIFVSECPYCHTLIEGNWDWEKGRICIQGYCDICKIFILEDEANWRNKEECCYLAGYITGLTDGDGTVCFTPKNVPYRKKQRYWRVALKDKKILVRLQKSLEAFEIYLVIKRFSKGIWKLESRKFQVLERLREVFNYSNQLEYKRGWLAGIYDAEGNHHKANLRIYNFSLSLQSKVIRYAKEFDFKFYKQNYPSIKGNNVGLKGNKIDKQRFFDIIQPVKKSYYATHTN